MLAGVQKMYPFGELIKSRWVFQALEKKLIQSLPSPAPQTALSNTTALRGVASPRPELILKQFFSTSVQQDRGLFKRTLSMDHPNGTGLEDACSSRSEHSTSI